MSTYRFAANSVLEVLKQTSDDAFSIDIVAYWCSVVANRLRQQHLKKQDFDRRNGTFLSIFDNVPVTVSNNSQAPDVVAGRKWVQLPEPLVELPNDGGVDFISYTFDTGCCDEPSWLRVPFQRTTPAAAHRLMLNPYEKPSPENPYFYVVGSKIYFLGTECVTMHDVELGLRTNKVPNTPCKLDDPIDIPEHLMETLIAQVANMGRFLLAYPSDRTNDGFGANADGGKTGFDRRQLGNLRPSPSNVEQMQDQEQL